MEVLSAGWVGFVSFFYWHILILSSFAWKCWYLSLLSFVCILLSSLNSDRPSPNLRPGWSHCGALQQEMNRLAICRFPHFQLLSVFQWMWLMCCGLAPQRFVHMLLPTEWHLQSVHSTSEDSALREHLHLPRCKLEQHQLHCDKTSWTATSLKKSSTRYISCD